MNIEVSSSKTEIPAAEKWIKRLEDAHRREKSWRKLAGSLVELYECTVDEKSRPYNIMYATTDTLAPALYNNVPRPVVKPRFVQRQAELARVASIAAQRVINFGMDYSDSNSSSFDECMRASVLTSLVCGRGQMRVRYEADIKAGEGKTATETIGEKGANPITGDPSAPGMDAVQAESVVYENVPWDQFLHGYAQSWDKVPWVAFCHMMNKSQLAKSFGKEVVAKLKALRKGEDGDNDLKFTGAGPDETTNQSGLSKNPSNVHSDHTEVWEIWDKTEKKVIFVCPNLRDTVLNEVDDPLQLKGFFPCPKPMMMFRRVKGLTPQALYETYSSQARELNNLTIRIRNLIAACRVRGFYNGAIEEMSKLFESDDNVMLPVTNAAQLTGQGLSLDNAIWLMPLDKISSALEKLYLQRQQIKAIIFELTGIADIMRGSSQASETLGAQQLKNQWGSLRLKRMQYESNRFAQDMMRLHLEVSVNFMSPELLRDVTNMPLPTAQEQQQAEMVVQQGQMQLQSFQQQAQMPPQDPNAPPPQMPPEVQQLQQEVEQAQAILSVPSMDQILEMLQDDAQRTFNISVDSNSMVDAEASDDKQDMTEMLNALGQFVSGTTPMMEAGIMSIDTIKTIMLSLLRRFRMGSEVEEAVMQMQGPQQPQQDEQAQAELQQAQQELQQKQQELDQALVEFENQKKQFQMEQQMAQRQAQMAQQMALKELQMQQQMDAKSLDMDKTLLMKQLDMDKQIQVMEIESLKEKARNAIQAQADAFQAQVSSQEAAEKAKEKEKSSANVSSKVPKV